MRTVWLVESGEYSDRYTEAVCSSYEQAAGVAVMLGADCYVGGSVDMWEEVDEIPPYKLIHQCIVRPGPDSTRPIDVRHDLHPIAINAPMPEPKVVTSTGGYRWARAERYPSAELAETAAREAYEAP